MLISGQQLPASPCFTQSSEGRPNEGLCAELEVGEKKPAVVFSIPTVGEPASCPPHLSFPSSMIDFLAEHIEGQNKDLFMLLLQLGVATWQYSGQRGRSRSIMWPVSRTFFLPLSLPPCYCLELGCDGSQGKGLNVGMRERKAGRTWVPKDLGDPMAKSALAMCLETRTWEKTKNLVLGILCLLLLAAKLNPNLFTHKTTGLLILLQLSPSALSNLTWGTGKKRRTTTNNTFEEK